MTRPRLPTSAECVTCMTADPSLPFAERQRIAEHRLEHRRIDRRRAAWQRERTRRFKPCPGYPDGSCLTKVRGGGMCRFCSRSMELAA